MEFGRVRIRLWYVCFVGGNCPCHIMTMDENFKYDWNVMPVRTQCCVKDGNHLYRQKWKTVMQISALDQDFLIFIDSHNWSTDTVMYQNICKMAEIARYSEGEVKRDLRETRKFTFEQVFRQAKKEEVQPCVDLQKMWFLKPNIQLPDWSYELVYGIVKHCR